MSLTVDQALGAVRTAEKEAALALETAIRAEHAAIEAGQLKRAADMRLTESQRILIELVGEEARASL